VSPGIVVLGMHRSGTSLISEVLHRWGAFGRVNECLPSDQWNARGYWEYSPLVDFNERLLQETGATWSFPPSQRNDARLADLAEQPAYRDEATRLLASMKTRSKKGRWFWKDPRLSLLLPFWQKIWGDVRYIICVRDPVEICLSLKKRDNLTFPVSILLWQRYMLSILEWTRNSPAIAILYSNMLQNPATECARLSHFLTSAHGPHISAGASTEMAKAVDRELRHCESAGRPIPAALTDSQKELQETLERMANCGVASAEANLKRCSLPSAWRSTLWVNLMLLRCQRHWNRARLSGQPVPLASTLSSGSRKDDLLFLAIREWVRW
jgi:hypothetical protein